MLMRGQGSLKARGYPCCTHCGFGRAGGGHPWYPRDTHPYQCSQGCNDAHIPDSYVEQADANPERVNNGCQIYKAN